MTLCNACAHSAPSSLCLCLLLSLVFFDLFDQDHTGQILEPHLKELVRSVYLAPTVQAVALKTRAFLAQAKQCKNENDLNTQVEDMTLAVSFEDFQRVCDKFPNLLFPQALTG